MEEERITLEIDGNEYFLIETILSEHGYYYYFSNFSDVNDVCVYKDGIIDGEDSYIPLVSDDEYAYSMSLFFDKHRNDNYEGAAN